MAARREILRGPGKYSLSAAFFNKILRETPPLEFVIATGGQQQNHEYLNGEAGGMFLFSTVLDQIGWEDGSGDSWNFHGRLKYPDIGRVVYVRGHYSTKTGAGWVIFETIEEKSRSEFLHMAEALSSLLNSDHRPEKRVDENWINAVLERLGMTVEQYECAKDDGVI